MALSANERGGSELLWCCCQGTEVRVTSEGPTTNWMVGAAATREPCAAPSPPMYTAWCWCGGDQGERPRSPRNRRSVNAKETEDPQITASSRTPSALYNTRAARKAQTRTSRHQLRRQALGLTDRHRRCCDKAVTTSRGRVACVVHRHRGMVIGHGAWTLATDTQVR